MKTAKQSIEAACDVSKLTPHPDNPRNGDIEMIGESIDAHGFYGAVIAQTSTGRILAGNHRYHAALERGATQLPVVWVDIDDDDAAALMLADNRTSDQAKNDEALLAGLLQKLAADRGLQGTGYNDDDLSAILESVGAGVGLGDPGAAELPGAPVTQLGDTWQLGDHLLVCGDATDPSAYDVFEPADCVWTDPPYGVDYAKAVDGKGNKRRTDSIQNDNLSHTDLERLWFGSFTQAGNNTKQGGAYYISAPQGDLLLLLLLQSMDKAGFLPRHMLVWVKDSLVLGRSDYHYRHEPIFYGWKKGAARTWNGGRNLTSVLEFPRPRASKLHPTMKPVDLIVSCIRNSTDPGATVLDCFAGSGSTLIACQETGRKCNAVELDPAYCDVICERFERATGITPIRDGTAISFVVDYER